MEQRAPVRPKKNGWENVLSDAYNINLDLQDQCYNGSVMFARTGHPPLTKRDSATAPR